MRVTGIAAALVLVSFTACSLSDSGKPKQWTGELPIADAFLRKQLPPGVLTYGRVPNLLGLLTMPKQSQLDAALRSEANITNVANIQEGLAQNVLALPAFSDPRIKFLAHAVRSPVEVAGLLTPNPTALIGVTLTTRSVADFNQLFTELGQVSPSVSLAAPLDDQGIGELAGLPLAAFVKFDPASGRLLLLAGPNLDRAVFERILGSLPAELKDHPMYALEQKIDASGQGLFLWADMGQVVQMAQTSSPAVAQQIGRAGLGGLRGFAFGVGTANGKGRLSFVLDAGEKNDARPFPVVANDVKATAVGDPDAAILFSLPSPAEFTRLESVLLDALPSGAQDGWQEAKAGLGELIGVDLVDIFAAIGPEIVALFDQAGDYTAVRLRDPDLFDELVRKIAAKTGSGPVEQKIGGTTFWHWQLPSIFSFAASPGVAAQAGLGGDFLTVLGRVRNHVYWIRDGEYLYVAQAPQPVIDRVDAGAKASVADWLATTQRVDMSTSLFAATGSVNKMPRRTYEMYISILQYLADLTGAKFDIWSMPTVDQLGLPDKGAIGFSFNLGEPYLSLELSYESHPGELFFGGGGFGGIAAVGILAAIAIPAYQDYTIRAQVTEGLNLASTPKVAVAEGFAVRGSVPRDRRAAGLPPSAGETSGKYVESVNVVGGVIAITYGNEANRIISGQTLTMTPFASPAGDVVWVCGYGRPPAGMRPLARGAADVGTTIAPKYLPAACR
jgi:Tfp pilus assembly major pilin PilA